MFGELERLVHRTPLYWTESQEKLTDAEADRIYSYLEEHFDRKRIKYKYSI